MSNPGTDCGGRAPRIPGRRGGRVAAGLGLVVLVCALTGPSQAQEYKALDEAVEGIAKHLVQQVRLREKQIVGRDKIRIEGKQIVGLEQVRLREKPIMVNWRDIASSNAAPNKETRCIHPFSNLLSNKVTSKFREQGVKVVSSSNDDDQALTFRMGWNIERGSKKLRLIPKVVQLDGNEIGLEGSGDAKVPLADIDRKYLEPGLAYQGCTMVEEFEKQLVAFKQLEDTQKKRYHLYMRPFEVEGISKESSETISEYLHGPWRREFVHSKRFALVNSEERADGELHGTVYISYGKIRLEIHDKETQEIPGAIDFDLGREDLGSLIPFSCAGLVDAHHLTQARRCYEQLRSVHFQYEGIEEVAQKVVRQGLERIDKAEKAQAEEEDRRERLARAVRVAFDGAERALGPGELWKAKGHVEELRKLDAGDVRIEGLKSRIKGLERELGEVVRTVGRRFRECKECPWMVVVPKGSFDMGSPESEAGRRDNEGPVHRARIERPFAVGVYEVTRQEFGWFVSVTDYSAGDSCRIWTGKKWETRSGMSWESPGFNQRGGHPVVCVNWNDAKAYVRWLSRKTGEEYRLLSESEWEYMARGRTKTARYWGESETGQCEYANGADHELKKHISGRTVADCDDARVHTSPVGSYKKNGYGLHDVLGNVWEWVEDCWNGSYRGAPADGSAWKSGDCSGRVLRGGAWLDDPVWLRSASRIRVRTGGRDVDSGIRVARTLTP